MSSLAASGKRTIVFALSGRPSISFSEMGNVTFGIATSPAVSGFPPAALRSVRSSGLPMVVFHTPGATSVHFGVIAGGISVAACAMSASEEETRKKTADGLLMEEILQRAR